MGYITIELTGRRPLVCHNGVLADPDNKVVQEIASITGKRTKTEEDRRAVEKLEWFGGLYYSTEFSGPAMPTRCLMKCFNRGGVLTRQGTQLLQAITFDELDVPIVYDGPRDLNELWLDSSYHMREMVKVGTNRIPRMRPMFPRWSIVATAFLLEDVMDFADFNTVINNAGRSVGLGDARILGYGRFTAEVREAA